MSLRAAVLGHPISHSKSPALHLAAYSQLGIGISYTAIDVTEELLPSLMGQIRDQPGWRGLSVTMPLKTAMLGQVDEVRGVARTLGVVNTVSFEEHGGVRGILGGDHVRSRDDMGLSELVGGPELAPIHRHGLMQRIGREVGCEGVGQAEGSGQLGTEQRRAQDVERHVGPGTGDRLDTWNP